LCFECPTLLPVLKTASNNNNNNTLSKLGTGIALLVYWLGYNMDKSEFEFRPKQDVFLLSRTSRSTLKPKHSIVQ
jgi:hypothetical protein